MTTETIDIQLREDGSRIVRRNFGDLATTAERTASSVDLLTRSMRVLSSIFLTNEIFKMADAYTTLQNKLAAAGVATNVMTKLTKELFAVADETRASAEATGTIYSRLALSTKEMGVSYQDLLDITKSLNQALILSGATGHEAAAGLLQLSQAIAANRLGGDELRSILEQLPVVADVIARQMGVTRGELRKLGSDGKITADVILKAFQNARVELNDRFARTVPTVSQAFTVLNNAVLRFVGEMNKAVGASATVAKILITIADNIDVIGKAFLTLSGVVVAFAGAAVIGKIVSALSALATAAMAHPLVALIAALVAATAGVALFGDEILIGVDKATSLKDVFRSIGEQVGPVFNELRNLATTTFAAIGAEIGTFDFTIADVMRGTAAAIGTTIGTIEGSIQVISKVTADVAKVIVQIWDGVTTGVLAMWGQVQKGVGEFVTNTWAGLSSWATKVGTVLGDWLPSGIKTMFEAVYKWTVDLFQKLFTWIVKVVNGVREFFGAAAKDIGGSIADEWKAGESGRVQILSQVKGYGEDLGIEFNKGFINNNTGVTEWVDKTIADATAIGMRRLHEKFRDEERRYGSDNLTGRGKNTQKTPAGKDGSKAANALANQILELERRINPAREAMAEYEKNVKLIDKALKGGVITQAKYNQLMGAAKEHYRENVDEAFKAQREFQAMISTMQEAMQAGVGFGQADAVRQVSTKYPDMFFGTDQEIRNKVSTYQQTMAQIQMLQNAQLINETTANQMRIQQAGLLKQAITDAALQAAQFRLNSGAGDWADVWLTALGRVQEGFTTFTAGASAVTGDFLTSFTDGFANSIGQAIVYSEDLGASLYKVAQGALSSLISGFVKLGIQWLINEAIGQSIAATSSAASVALGVATGTALASAYAPAAAMASLASFGANAAPAMAGITATNALAQALALTGFSKGGYTGNMGRGDVAGLVHGKEFVMNAQATRRIGVPNLNAMQSGRMAPSQVASNSEGPKSSGPIKIFYYDQGTKKDVSFEQLSENEIRIIARDEAKGVVKSEAPSVIAGDLRNPNSSTSKAISRNTLAGRRR